MPTKLKHQKKKLVHVLGFTLIEFIVIISIFAIVASIALFNFSGFNSNISLSNLTHDVALAVRSAQVYGISSVGDQNAIENPIPHGVAFNFDTALGEYDREIIVFDDLNGNSFVDANNEITDTMLMQSSDYISEIRVQQGNGSSVACTAVGGIRIVFKRPDPNPDIYCGPFSFARAVIEVSSSDGAQQKYINIEPTGQISVQ